MTEQPTTPLLETLVGEGRKYSNGEELAKGYIHADQFIATLKAEKDTLSEQFETMKSLVELLQQAKPAEPTPPAPEPKPLEVTPLSVPPKTDAVDVEQVVANFLAKKEEHSRQEQVTQKVLEFFKGDRVKAGEHINQKAREIGVPSTWFDDIASRSPEAALQLLGIGVSKPNVSIPPSQGTVNSEALKTGQPVASGERDFNYYNTLRRENPRLFAAPETQRQKEQDVLRLGLNKYLGKE